MVKGELNEGGIIFMNDGKDKLREIKKPTFLQALVPIVVLLVTLTYFLKQGQDPHIPLFFNAIFAGVYAIVLFGYKWADLEEGSIEVIKMSMSAVLILMVIGMVVGTWVASGVVPTMIYYGLKILSPSIFLIATLIICSIVSIATGSSWTTAATVGLALMGVGQGLGFSAPMIGGAVISGAYFGDKMSPLSDTTNLAPAVSGATLFDHIKHMVYTVVPSYTIALIVFGFFGMQAADRVVDQTAITVLMDAIAESFNVTPLLLLVPVIVIGAVIMKVPALPGLFGGALLGGAAMIIFQGMSVVDVAAAMQYGVGDGVVIETANETLAALINRGGMQSMMWTISLIVCALTFGGIMEKTGMLKAIADGILHIFKGRGGLVFSTVITCFAMNVIAGDQYLSIVIPGRMYKTSYDEMGLAPKNLSRVLEDTGTMTSPLIPWNTCGAYMMVSLGLAPWTYVPYCIVNLLNPIISIIYGYTGFSMEMVDKDKKPELATE